MDGGLKLLIHQTVHGYDEGHSMLASSCPLSSREKIALLKMSDLSGSTSGGDFAPYLTGYPIPESNYYALAKTWNAPEMKRPGCVWTHTLLISLPILGQLKNFASLEGLFRKPDEKHLKFYSTPIQHSVSLGSNDIFDREYFDLLTFHVYEVAEKPILLLDNYSDTIGKDLLNLWNYQWPGLRRSFSFCTGAFSIRYNNDKPLDVQVIPRQSDLRFNSKTLRGDFFVIDKLKNEEAMNSQWLQLFKESNLEKLLTFMFAYGSDLEGKRGKYIALFLAFTMSQQIGYLDNQFVQMMKFVQQYFPDRKEAKTFKRDLLYKLIEIEKRNLYYFLLQSLNGVKENEAFGDLELDYSEIIKELWERRTISRIELINILRNVDQATLGERAANLLAGLPVETWMMAPWLDEELIAQTLSINLSIVDESIIWSDNNHDQKQWYDSLNRLQQASPNPGILEKLVPAMVKERNDKFAESIVKKYGDVAVNLSLRAIDSLKITLPAQWEKSILPYSDLLLKWIGKSELTHYKLTLLLKIISSNRRSLNNLPIEWVKVIHKIENCKYPDLVTKIFSHLLALSFENYFKESDVIISLVFQKIHDDAKFGNIEDEYWNLIVQSLPNQRLTAPDRKLMSKIFGFNDDHVPSWDRCELLRRSLVESFIIFGWNYDLIFSTAHDTDTFERIIKFCTKSDPGTDFIRRLRTSKVANKHPKFAKITRKFK